MQTCTKHSVCGNPDGRGDATPHLFFRQNQDSSNRASLGLFSSLLIISSAFLWILSRLLVSRSLFGAQTRYYGPCWRGTGPADSSEPLSEMYAKAPETLLAVFRWRL